MRFTKITLAAVMGLAIVAMVSPMAQASSLNIATAATFDKPVAIPGMVLPAGSYVFAQNGPAVQIFDKDQILVATLLTNAASRQDDRSGSEFEIASHGTGPNTLAAWFFDGASVGREFIYSAH